MASFRRSDRKSLSSGKHSKKRNARSVNSRASRSYDRSQIKYVTPASSTDSDVSKYSRQVASQGYLPRRRKKRRRKRILVTVVTVVAVLVLGGGAAAFAYMGFLNNQLRSNIDDIDALNAALVVDSSQDDPFYMLLMGTDGRNDEESDRSDSIILARVDPQSMQVVLISIPRDTRVYIEGYGYQKINAAYAYGGAAGAVEAVEEFAGVEISHYAEVDFSGFVDLVDALGGVEVNVPIEIDDEDAGGYVAAGLQTLNGEQALIFCRSRDTAIGDYQRQANQRIFLQALAEKVLSADPVTLLSSINAIASCVGTDMDVAEIYSIASMLRGMGIENIYTYSVPSSTSTIDGISYVIADESEWEEMMSIIDSGGLPDEQDWTISGIIPDEYNSVAQTNSTSTVSFDRSDYEITVRNGGGIEGSAGEAAEMLTDVGYEIQDVGNANQFVYTETLVIYNDDDDLEIANDIISVLGKGTAVQSAGRYSFDGDLLVVVGSDWGT